MTKVGNDRLPLKHTVLHKKVVIKVHINISQWHRIFTRHTMRDKLNLNVSVVCYLKCAFTVLFIVLA